VKVLELRYKPLLSSTISPHSLTQSIYFPMFFRLTDFHLQENQLFHPIVARVGGVVVSTSDEPNTIIPVNETTGAFILHDEVNRGTILQKVEPSPAPKADLFDFEALPAGWVQDSNIFNDARLCIGRGTLAKLIHCFDSKQPSYHIQQGFCLQIKKVEDKFIVEDTVTWEKEAHFSYAIENLMTRKNNIFADREHIYQYSYCTLRVPYVPGQDVPNNTILLRHEVDCFQNGQAQEIKSHKYNRKFPTTDPTFHDAICVFLGCTQNLVSVFREDNGATSRIRNITYHTRERLFEMHGTAYRTQYAKAYLLLSAIMKALAEVPNGTHKYIIYTPGSTRVDLCR
jgi:hypothetical protein